VTDLSTQLQRAAERPQKILVISPTPTHPQNAGSRARIFHLLHNLKSLGHEVHLFLLDKEFRSNHVSEGADLEAMQRAWDGFFYMQDQPRMKLGGLADRLGLGSLSRALAKGDAAQPKGPLWKARSWLVGNAWRLQKFKYLITGNLWRVTKVFEYPLRLPSYFRRAVGAVLRVMFPPLYRRLKPYYPDHTATPPVETAETAEPKMAQEISQIDSWYNFDIDQVLKSLQEQEHFDAVIVEYVYLSRALTNFGPAVLKLIDTHDVFTNRNRQFEDMGLVETFFNTTRDEEAKGLDRADVIVAIQDKEREKLQTLTDRPVFTVGHTVELRKPNPLQEVRPAVLFIGAANVANIHSVNWFIDEVLPLIRKENTDFCFYVAGQVCAFVDDHEQLVKLGEVGDADDIYAHADVVINPAVVGSGLKIKCVEALGRGKVLVSSPHASTGLHNEGKRPYIEAYSAGDFASAIANLFNNAPPYNDFAMRAYRHARNYNRVTRNALQSLLDRRPTTEQAGDSRVRRKQAARAQRQSGESTNFILLASARTGSTTLADLLNSHPAVSCLREPFNPEHGIKWGKKPYARQLQEGVPLCDVVRDIFSEYTGFKHLTEQLTPANNNALIQFPACRRIFLWRRNHLQRVISNYISMRAGHWHSDVNKILVANFQPIDIDELKRRIARQRKQIERYRELCEEMGCFVVSYEDLFDPHHELARKHKLLDEIFDYLGIEKSGQLPTSVSERIQALLNPEVRKLNSPLTYQLIPNIEEIEKYLGSVENGYLFS